MNALKATLSKLLDTLLPDPTVAEQRELDEYLSQATSPADVERLQRQWDDSRARQLGFFSR